MGLFDSIRKAISSRKADDRSSLSGRVQAHPQDPAARHKLGLFLLKQGEVIEGIDQLGYLRRQQENIESFEEGRPWKP